MATTVQGTTRLPTYSNARVRTGLAFWFMVATAIAAAAIAALFAVAIALLGIDGSGANLEGWAGSLNTAADTLTVVSTVALVAGLVWLYRAVANLAALGYPGSASPVMAVVWWFVPVAFFVMPYRVMRDLYAHSASEHHLLGGRLVQAWWASWWISWALFVVDWLVTPTVSTVPGGLLIASLALLYSLALVAVAGLGAVLIRAVSHGQRQLATYVE